MGVSNKTLTISLPHNLGREAAKKKVMEGLAKEKVRFASMAQIEDRWEGDRLEFKASAMGQAVTGRADVADDAVVIHVDLPWMLAMMAGKIRGEIEQQGKKLLQ